MSSGLNIINADSKIDIVQNNLDALHTLTTNSIDNLGSELDRRYTKTDTDMLLNLKQNNLTISPMNGESILATNTTSQLKTISPNPDDNDINISTSSSTDGSQRINIGSVSYTHLTLPTNREV